MEVSRSILSPMPTGNGAHVVHQMLEQNVENYQLCDYNPYWTLLPPSLSWLYRNRAIAADIIHTTPDYGSFFKKTGKPLVVTFHNYVLDNEAVKNANLFQRIHYKTDLLFFTRRAVLKANAITAVSRFIANLVKSELNVSKPIEVIYNGVDSRKFVPKKRRHNKKIKVLFSGNLTQRKGANLLPEIAKNLDKNIEILYTSGLRTKNKLPGAENLVNLGSIPYSEMPSVYQEADILLFPTVREGFGLAAAEAMACGLPVVATNCSSLPELVIDGKGGYLCGMGDVLEFSSRINELASSHTLRRNIGEFNRERVESMFTIERMASDYKRVFSSV